MPEERSNVRQIMPAGEWYAAFAVSGEPFMELKRLICFAIFESENNNTGLDGVTSDFMRCVGSMKAKPTGGWELPHFMNFYHERDLTSELREKLIKQARSHQNK